MVATTRYDLGLEILLQDPLVPRLRFPERYSRIFLKNYYFYYYYYYSC